MKNAGTDAYVYLTFYETGGSASEFLPDRAERDDERGAASDFQLPAADLG